MDAVNIGSMLARFSEHWAPKKIAELNDYEIKIVGARSTARAPTRRPPSC